MCCGDERAVNPPEPSEVLAAREREERSVTARAFLRLYGRRSPRDAARGRRGASTAYTYRRAWVDFGLFLRWRLGEGPLGDWTDASKTHRAAMTDESLAFVDAHVAGVRPADVEHYLAKLYDRPVIDSKGRPKMGLQPSTIGVRVGALVALFAAAVDMGMVAESPMERVKRPRPPRARPYKKRALQEVEVRQLIDAIPDGTFVDRRDRMLIVLLARLGLRRAEVARIVLDDLELADPDDGMPGLVVEVPRLRVHRKGDKVEWIVLPRDLVRPLMVYLEELPGPAVFPAATTCRCQPTGMPLGPDAVTKMVRARSLEALGRKVSPHALRRTFITAALEEGAPLHVVQRYVGHDDPRTTMGYADEAAESREPCAAEFVSYGVADDETP